MVTLAAMTTAECWQRLGAQGVGRIGFDRGRGPRIHPINYTVVDKTIQVRTTEDSELGSFVEMFAGGALVSFEVDHVAAPAQDRWSVLISARIERLSVEQEHTLAPGQVPNPAPSGSHPVLVRLTPTEITGRRLVDPPATAGSGPGHQDPDGRLGARTRAIPSTWLG